jgi:elongation factor G
MNFDSKNIRNVVLLGHSGVGKTSFVECMLYEAKAISRRGKVEDKNTTSDFTNIEQAKGNSIFSTLMHANWKDCKINIIDTPGFDDFIGEVISSLKVADTGLMLLNAKYGVEVGTEIIWEYVQEFHTPCMFVVNQLDVDNANFENTIDQAKSRFGNKIVVVQYPYNQGKGFNSIIDALKMVMYVFPNDGGKPEKKPIPDHELAKATELHQKLVEAAAENDENLMDHFFENGTLSEEELAQGLTEALAHQQIYPVFCTSATKNMGSGRIMGFLHDIAPSPADRPDTPLEKSGTIACNDAGKTSLFIYKTMSEPNVGNVSYFKVYSGTIKAGDDLVNADNDSIERFNQMYISEGKNRELVNILHAGDLGVTVKLKNTHTNNTLNIKGNNIQIKKIDFPKPRMRTAVVPPNKNDIEKLAKALHVLHEEDPTLIVEHSQELKQTIIHGQGQLHLDMLKYRIEMIYGLHIDFTKPKISYRETIMRKADSEYQHKKQSGGAGQYAKVHMRVEPFHEGMPNPEGLTVRNTEVETLAWGGKLVLNNCIVGGVIDAKYMSAIKKGILQRMNEGPLTGSHCMDIRVSVYDGKMHAVDSNDMAFQIASAMCFKEAFEQANPQILEPLYDLTILCSDEVMGDIMGDLQTRRAIIMGMDSDGHYQKIMARVPLVEMHDYSSSLRSLSQGKAKFDMQFAHYETTPPEVQKQLVDIHKKEVELEHAHH